MLMMRDLARLYESSADDFELEIPGFEMAGRKFDWNSECAVMGVINFSRGSWYRESVCHNLNMAKNRAKVLHAQGAHIIDVGAESTLSYTEKVDGESQLNQILPLLTFCNDHGIPVSVESYNEHVIRTCLQNNAEMINLTGNNTNEAIYEMIGDTKKSVVVCFVDGPDVRSVNNLSILNNPWDYLLPYFEKRIALAQKYHIDKIFLDPGMGFYYKNLEDSQKRISFQIQTILNAVKLRSLGFPVCNALPHAFEYFGDEVRTAESFFAVLAHLGKTSLLRTHEVAKITAVKNVIKDYEKCEVEGL